MLSIFSHFIIYMNSIIKLIIKPKYDLLNYDIPAYKQFHNNNEKETVDILCMFKLICKIVEFTKE